MQPGEGEGGVGGVWGWGCPGGGGGGGGGRAWGPPAINGCRLGWSARPSPLGCRLTGSVQWLPACPDCARSARCSQSPPACRGGGTVPQREAAVGGWLQLMRRAAGRQAESRWRAAGGGRAVPATWWAPPAHHPTASSCGWRTHSPWGCPSGGLWAASAPCRGPRPGEGKGTRSDSALQVMGTHGRTPPPFLAPTHHHHTLGRAAP